METNLPNTCTRDKQAARPARGVIVLEIHNECVLLLQLLWSVDQGSAELLKAHKKCVLLLQLLWTVDQGNALDVSGVADAAMRERLIELFSNLPLERTKKVQRPVCLLIDDDRNPQRAL